MHAKIQMWIVPGASLINVQGKKSKIHSKLELGFPGCEINSSVQDI